MRKLFFLFQKVFFSLTSHFSFSSSSTQGITLRPISGQRQTVKHRLQVDFSFLGILFALCDNKHSATGLHINERVYLCYKLVGVQMMKIFHARRMIRGV
jgi:hypothetical protein